MPLRSVHLHKNLSFCTQKMALSASLLTLLLSSAFYMYLVEEFPGDSGFVGTRGWCWGGLWVKRHTLALKKLQWKINTVPGCVTFSKNPASQWKPWLEGSPTCCGSSRPLHRWPWTTVDSEGAARFGGSISIEVEHKCCSPCYRGIFMMRSLRRFPHKKPTPEVIHSGRERIWPQMFR